MASKSRQAPMPYEIPYTEITFPAVEYRADPRFELVDMPEKFAALSAELTASNYPGHLVAVDTETQGLSFNRFNLIGLSLSYLVHVSQQKWRLGEFCAPIGNTRPGIDPELAAYAQPSSTGYVLKNVYIPLRHETGDRLLEPTSVLQALDRLLFSNPLKRLLLWNAKFDLLHFLCDVAYQLRLESVDTWTEENPIHRIDDGMVCKHLLAEETKEGKALKANAELIEKGASEAEKHLGKYITAVCKANKWLKPKKRGSGVHPFSPSLYQYVPTALMAQYAASDTHFTYRLTTKFLEDLRTHHNPPNYPPLTSLYQTEIALIFTLIRMEQPGVYVNAEYLQKFDVELAQKETETAARIYAFAGREFDVQSAKQLAEVFSQRGLPVIKQTPTGAPSTDAETLEKLADKGFQIADDIGLYRGIQKFRSTYINFMLETRDEKGRIYTNYNPVRAVTGRLSSNNPNLQNVPNVLSEEKVGGSIRTAFEMPPELRDDYFLLYVDWSQVEVRLTAHFSKDPLLVDSYRAGQDVHARTAQEIFGDEFISGTKDRKKALRNIAKRINFGIIYGIGATGLARQTKTTPDECKNYIYRYKKKYMGVTLWMRHVENDLMARKFIINPYGRQRRPFGYFNKGRTHDDISRASRQAVNFLPQGTGADMLKTCMVQLDRWIRANNLKTRMAQNIHDEIVFWCHKDEVNEVVKAIKTIMETFTWCSVPILVEIAYSLTNWKEKKEVSVPDRKPVCSTPSRVLAAAW